jgi:hypothetical protein
MITNDRVFRCACKVRSLQHCFTTDASGRFVLFVDLQNLRLLQDAAWNVSPVHRKSRLLRARATTSAPGIRVGQSLHQLVARVRNPKRWRVHAINRNYLDARKVNLRTVTRSDIRILNRTAPANRAVGVRRNTQPKFMKSWFCPWSAHIGVDGKNLYLGAFRTLEEAQAAWDAAAIMLHGPKATTNASLGLLSTDVAKTKPCRRAAKVARRVIKDHRSGELARKYRALVTKSRRKQLEIFASVRTAGKPVPEPAVKVVAFRTAAARPRQGPGDGRTGTFCVVTLRSTLKTEHSAIPTNA